MKELLPAPTLSTLRKEVDSSGPVVMDRDPAPEGVVEFAMPWRGVVKLPGAGADGLDRAIELELWPDSRALYALLETGKAMPMIAEFAPVMAYDAFEGDLRADAAQSSSVLDTLGMRRSDTGVVGAGQTADLGDGLTVSFPELRQYTVLQVTRDRGLPIVLLAAILILLGLIPALYGSRRKLWVTAEPDGPGSPVLALPGALTPRVPPRPWRA